MVVVLGIALGVVTVIGGLVFLGLSLTQSALRERDKEMY